MWFEILVLLAIYVTVVWLVAPKDGFEYENKLGILWGR